MTSHDSHTAWTRIAGVLIAALVAFTAPVAAEDEPMPTPQQMWRELRDLRNEVGELRKERGDNWLNERRADEIKALVHEVLADADTRASLMAEGMTAGFDGSDFFLAAADGSFLLKVGGQLQVRYLASARDDGGGSVDGFEGGTQIRRAKVGFSGHIGNPKLEYNILLAANRNSTVVELEDAWIAYRLKDDLRIWAGRFMDRFALEQFTSSRRQLTVDRSAVANIVAGNDGYVEGVGIEWNAAPDKLKLALTINDGLNSGTAGGTAPGFQNGGNDFNVDATDIAFTGRIDLKVIGDWKQTADTSSWSDAGGKHLFLGLAAHYEAGETGDGNASAMTAELGPYDSFFQWTADALLKVKGIGIAAAVYGWHFDASAGNALGDTDHYAATVQVGVMVVPDKFEPFARYEWLGIDDALATNDLHIATFGFNWYFRKHHAKLTADLVWAMSNINTTSTLGFGLTGIGLLPDAAGETDQIVVRVQFQLLF